jgi:hypothetical protein
MGVKRMGQFRFEAWSPYRLRQDLDECDWQGRFGFQHLDLMKAKYERPEP